MERSNPQPDIGPPHRRAPGLWPLAAVSLPLAEARAGSEFSVLSPDTGFWFAGALLLAAAGGAWWAARRAEQQNRRLTSVLEFTDCLVWQGLVTLNGPSWTWAVKVQKTGLSRRLFGRVRAPEIAGLWTQFEVPELEEMNRRCRDALDRGLEAYEQEFRVIHKGLVLWLRESVTITRLGTNRFSLVGLVTDITARREIETARRASEERLGQLLSRSDCLLWQARVTGNPAGHTDWEWFIPDSELYRRVGGTAGPERRMPWDRSLVPEYPEINARAATALRDGQPGYTQEFRVVLPSGVLWLREQVAIEAVKPQEWRLEGVIVDITAVRQAEEAKRASEEQLAHVMEAADFMLWHARVFRGPEGAYHWVTNVPDSKLYRRVFGEAPVPPETLPWSKVVDPKAVQTMQRRAEQAFADNDAGYEQELHTRNGNEAFWLHEQASVRVTAPGEWQVVGIVTDVTRRHQAEEARQGSERALREILERANCLLWRATVRRQGEHLEWTHFELPASRLFVQLRGGGMAFDAQRLWEFADVPELAEMNARSTRAMLAGESGYEQEFRASVGGRTFWLHEHVTINRDGDDGWKLVGVITDVTLGREAMEAQRRSEGRLQELLKRADCMIWQGRVTKLADGGMDWQVYVPPSRLYRRIFDDDPSSGPLNWEKLGVPEYPAMIEHSRAALLSGAADYEQAFHIPKPNGDIWVTEQVSITAVSPGVWDCMGVVTDVTARREAEVQLERILEFADCMVWESKVTERVGGELDWTLYAPRSVLHRRLFGDTEDAPSLDWRRLEVPEVAEMEARAHEAVRRRAAGYEQEFRVVQPGQVVWLHEVVTIQAITERSFRLVGVITDITAQREAQEAHRASLAQVEQMLAGAECLLWQARVFEGAPGSLRWLMFMPRSRLHRELFGRDPGSPVGLPWSEVLDPATEQEINQRAKTAILQGAPSYEQEFRAQRGERGFWLHERASVTPVGPGEWKLVGVITDLTARREAEQSLRASELRYRTLYEHTPVAILEVDFARVANWLAELRAAGVVDLSAWLDADAARLYEGARLVQVVDCNATAMTMLRARKKSDFSRRRGVLASADSMRVIKDVTLAIWEGRNRHETEIDMFDFEGGLHRMNLRWWMEREGPLGGHPQSVVAMVDLTDLKRAESALASEKERLAVTLRAMAEGVITTDVSGVVQFMNEAAAQFTGWPASVAIGRPVGEICRLENDRTSEGVEVPVARVAQGDVVIELPSTTRLMAKEGSGRLVEGCCAPIHSAASRVIGTVLVFRDVTEHERLEQELVRATKLESVGILAGGIAHDFNNILTAVMGNVALAMLDIDPNSDAGRSLADAEKATLRARDLTQQLLTFAKGGEPVRASVKLDAVVREVVNFSLHGSKVKAHFSAPADLWAANADKGQIGRVVQNLVLNAVQAMPEGGTVGITLANEQVDGLQGVALAPGNYVRIEISDTGLGIRPEHLPRIFDPYFTTKQTGSGLGLAAVYSIVHKHHGTIDVRSQLGAGSTFRIWLPASAETASNGGDGREGPAPGSMKGRVLFMDDEEPIRQMATFLLRRFGFDVECVADGAAAIEKFRYAHEDGEPFALVIMDLTVPGGMGGKETITHLRAIDPKVRAIVSSGYSSDPVLANYREHGFCGVVAKPYEMGDLARVLREALAK